jgi:nucleotide-binding universal stress UspA family protein
MYKRILVPLDGSPRAEAILPHAEELAACLDAKVVLLRVFEPDFSLVDPYGHPPEFYEALREKWQDEVKSYLEAIRETLSRKGLRVRALIEGGPVVSTIIKVAERESSDLIAMASHGRTGPARVFYGSVAAGVLRQVDRPLLLVRAEEIGFKADGGLTDGCARDSAIPKR